MAKLFKLRVITQEEIFYEGEVSSVNVGTVEGRRQVLAGHSTLIAVLKPGLSKITYENGEEKKFDLSSGIMKVNKEEVLILSDNAKWSDDIIKDKEV